jgi:putative phage-type endonuclease
MSRAKAARPLESGRAETEDRTAEVTAFAAAARWTGESVEDRAAWLARRDSLLTASDMAAVLGLSPWTGPVEVYARKVTPPREPEPIGLDDPRFWGSILEQPILRAVAAYHGWKYRPGGALLVSRRYEHLGATLDAEIDRGHGWEDFEGKTSRISAGWDQEQGELPTHVLIQVQHQLLVTGAGAAVVFALLQGSRPCMVEIEPSAELHAVIVEESQRFLELVKLREPPDPSASERDRRALERLYPQGGGAVRLPPEAVEWTREILALNKQTAELKKRGDELRNMLRATIGTASWGALPEPVEGKRWWRWQDESNAGYTVAPFTTRKLLAMVKGPVVEQDVPALAPAPPLPSLAQQLAESLSEPDSGATTAPPKKKRTKKEKAT